MPVIQPSISIEEEGGVGDILMTSGAEKTYHYFTYSNFPSYTVSAVAQVATSEYLYNVAHGLYNTSTNMWYWYTDDFSFIKQQCRAGSAGTLTHKATITPTTATTTWNIGDGVYDVWCAGSVNNNGFFIGSMLHFTVTVDDGTATWVPDTTTSVNLKCGNSTYLPVVDSPLYMYPIVGVKRV